MHIPDKLTSALRVTLLYLLFGALWIVLSDHVLGLLADTPATYQRWQSIKGVLFVLASGAVIYFLVRRELRLRRRGERLFAKVLDLVPDPVAVRRVGDQAYVEANRAMARMIGRDPEDVIGRTPTELGMRFEPAEWDEYNDRLAREGRVENQALRIGLPGDGERSLLVSGHVERFRGREHVFAVTRDVTELQKAREQAEAQVRRIQALRDIDMAITASLDLRLTLNVVLDQVLDHLEVDAASVLLLNRATRKLEYATSRGFRTPALRHTALGPGEGYAGRAARDRELVWVEDLAEAHDGLGRSPHFQDEEFVSYAAMPLAAKGRVNGVLEVFHRNPLDPPEDWFDFLEALAGQGSIAIDNAELYQELQRSNDELRDAYDRTIEGWARALDMRDRETHGHTRRVAEVTVKLAREMSVADEELVHIRRGALLHDIGKMGVPDTVLLKPGSLDEQEWEVMKKHPELAFRLLAPIDFLRPAIDIPHYHHEKWDGSGYPEGLRGRQIPLPARMFAVVDVWDALLSDRPYRDAWPEDEVYAHLEAAAGSHFDPEAVDAFFRLELEESALFERGGPEPVPGDQQDLFDGAS